MINNKPKPPKLQPPLQPWLNTSKSEPKPKPKPKPAPPKKKPVESIVVAGGRKGVLPHDYPATPGLEPQKRAPAPKRTDAADRPDRLADSWSIYEKMQFLRLIGYNITGPKQAADAWAARDAGIPPKTWNTAHMAKPVKPQVSGVATAPGAPPLGIPDIPEQVGLGKNPYGKYVINPGAYAKNVSDLEYGPVIAALLAQQKQQPKDAANAMRNIKGWFGQIGGTLGMATRDNARVSQAALGDYDAAMKGVLGSLDPGAAASVAGAGQFARAGIQGDALAQSNFDQRMKAVFASQQADAMFNENRYQQTAASDIAQKLLSARQERGSLYGKTLGEAQQTRLQQLAAIQNMQLAGKLAPYQVGAAAINNAQGALDVKTTTAQFQDWLQHRTEPGSLDQQTAIKLSNNLAENLVNDKGRPRYKLNQGIHLVDNLLQSYQFNTADPKIQQLRKLVIQRIYPGVTLGPNGPYRR